MRGTNGMATAIVALTVPVRLNRIYGVVGFFESFVVSIPRHALRAYTL